MFSNRSIGWAGVGLFALAVTCTVLVALALLVQLSVLSNPFAGIGVAGLLALAAAALGFAAFKTVQGKVAAIGGLSLLIGIVVLLSLTTITQVERTDSHGVRGGREPAMRQSPA